MVELGIKSKPKAGEKQPKKQPQQAAEEQEAEETHDPRKPFGDDFKLIEELRNLVRKENELEKGKYSSKHYKDILNPRFPLVCWRYLIQRDKNVKEALELMKNSIKWRIDEDLDEPKNREFIKEFWFYSSFQFTGTCRDGSHVLYVVGKNYRKTNALLRPVGKQFSANLLLNWDRKHMNDMDELSLVFDTTNTGYRNMDLDFMSWLVSVRDFIPARVARVSVVGVPIILRPIVRLVISWLPDSFRDLIECGTFDELVRQRIEPESLPPDVGGTAYTAYLAPVEAPWQKDSKRFCEPEMAKAIRSSFWFNVTEERQKIMQSMQLEYEKRQAKNKNKNRQQLEL